MAPYAYNITTKLYTYTDVEIMQPSKEPLTRLIKTVTSGVSYGLEGAF